MITQKAKVKRQNFNSKFKSILIFTFTFYFYLFTFTFLLKSYGESNLVSTEKLFLEGKYERVIYESEKLIDARSRQRDELYYLKALSELKTDKYKEARQTFGELLLKYPRSKRAFDAYIGTGDSYLLENQNDLAIKSYNEALEKFPRDKNIEVARSRIEDCRKKTGNNEKANDYPEAKRFIPQEVPRSEQASLFSVQVGSFKNKRNAENMSAKMRGAGYESYVETPVGAGSRFYRVKVGRFNSRQEAEIMSSRLKRSGYRVKICGD